ncbi:MAG TPA: TonB-dependent receptor plug domain-containing protein [Opitutaceae bacterium]|nr:TonB-dependent receptor plug domain-containing protein [Opitutaceae bacterium]
MIPNPDRLTATRRVRSLSVCAALLFGLPAALPAQTAPASNANSTSTSDDDVIQLTPFQVDTSRDNGYYSPNTLSGTRLNSNVQDLGGSITVVTKQQLEDTASIDINDIFKYEANTEGIYDFTATSSSSPTTDSIQSNPYTATRVRGLSAPNITIDYFQHTTRIPFDTYNIDSAEISRGPNSTVAGLGSPAGTINTNLQPANLTRSTNNVSFRVDQLGGWRSTFNVNRPVWQDKLAIRIAAVDMENKYRQKPSYDNVKRLYGALTFKPWANTTIRGKAEVYHENRQTPNALTPRDGISEWIAAGEPTFDPLNWTATVNGQSVVLPVTLDNKATFPMGLYANTNTYTRPSMFIDGGQVQLWEVNRIGTSSIPSSNLTSNVRRLSSGSAYMRGTVNAGTLYQVPGISNKALYDWTSMNAVPQNWVYDHAVMYTAEIEQKIIHNLYFRGAWHLEDSVDYSRNITNPPTLVMDVNQYLLDGRPNPYFKRPYISAFEPSIFRSPEYNDDVQASLTYSLNLERRSGWIKWLGNHQFGLNYEKHLVTDGTFRYREAVIDPNHVWLTPGALNYTNGNATGRPNYQYYVGPTGALGYTPGYVPPKSGVSGKFNLNYYNGATGTWISDPATFGTAPYISGLSRAETTTRSGTWQGHFIKDHLVVTGGIRKDFYRTRTSAGAGVNPNTGYYYYDTMNTWNAWTQASGFTRMISAVLYPFKSKWFSLTYSRSSSFQPQPQAVDLFDNALPNTYGHGQDVGFQLNLLNNKLVISLKQYKVTVVNDRTSNSTLGSRIARIEAGTYLVGTSSDKMSLYYWAQQQAIASLGASATQDQIDAAAAKITQFPTGFQNAVNAYNTGSQLRGVADSEGKGDELQVDFNPNYNWNFRLNATKTEAIQTTIENNLEDYINLRMPYWLSVKDPQGNPWWTSTQYAKQSAYAFYTSAVVVPLKIDQALLGKSNPQVKKYAVKSLATYRFTDGMFKNSFVGGSLRWDDKSVIGYLGGTPDADGIVRTLDVNKPIYDPARYAGDFWIGYSCKLFHDRVRAKFQFNLNNAFESGGLRITAVNPDGTPYNFRIINPRQWVLTSSFDF